MSNNNTTKSSGIGLPTILFVIFLVLKLCGVITWSWWWVTAPLWMSAALFVVIALVVVLPIAIYKALHKK